jgi:hypothetical protein
VGRDPESRKSARIQLLHSVDPSPLVALTPKPSDRVTYSSRFRNAGPFATSYSRPPEACSAAPADSENCSSHVAALVAHLLCWRKPVARASHPITPSSLEPCRVLPIIERKSRSRPAPLPNPVQNSTSIRPEHLKHLPLFLPAVNMLEPAGARMNCSVKRAFLCEIKRFDHGPARNAILSR